MNILPTPLQVGVALESSVVGHGLPAAPVRDDRLTGPWVASGVVEGCGRPSLTVTVTERDDDALTVACGDGAAVLTGAWTAQAVAGLICAAAGYGIGP